MPWPSVCRDDAGEAMGSGTLEQGRADDTFQVRPYVRLQTAMGWLIDGLRDDHRSDRGAGP